MADIKVEPREKKRRGSSAVVQGPHPNRQAYWGPDGVLTSDPDAIMTEDLWQLNVPGDPTQALTINRLNSSVSAGVGTVATGRSAFSEGFDTEASGDNAHAEGRDTTAAGINSHAEGDSTVATGASSHSEGLNTIASGAQAHAEGSITIASGLQSHAEGTHTTASGLQSHAEGVNTTAIAQAAHVEGLDSAANGAASHAEGVGTSANGEAAHAEGFDTVAGPGAVAAHAEGNTTIASGGAAHAEGLNTTASGFVSHASGQSSVASREAQAAHACGQFSTLVNSAGDAQTSVLVLRGTTPGVAINESVELKFGLAHNQTLQLEDNKTYTFRVTVTAGGVQTGIGGLRESTGFKLDFNVRRAGGVTVFSGGGTTRSATAIDGDAGTATWTLIASIGAGPDRVVLTFNTGAGVTAACFVSSKVEFTEAAF